MKTIKSILKSIFIKKRMKSKFPGSKKYWENRYNMQGNSGPGSYGHLALFKASVINEFIKKHSINSITELGCGDGNQLTLSSYPKYIGLDVSLKAIEICKKKFSEDKNKSFHIINKQDLSAFNSDLALSLDVIFHLTEDDVFFLYMNQLFNMSNKFVIIYSSNYDESIASHVKSRKFTDWIDDNKSKEWKLIKVIKNKYTYDPENEKETSISDFYIYKKV